MTAPPDPVNAVMAILAASSDVTALTSTRIYGEALPASQAGATPPVALVVQPAGGRAALAGPELRKPRIDVRAYGPTRTQARAAANAAYGALDWPPMVSISSASRVYAVEPETDILSSVEPGSNWPFAWFSVIVHINR